MSIANQINMSSTHEPRTSGLTGMMKGYPPKCLQELVWIEAIERGGHYLKKMLKKIKIQAKAQALCKGISCYSALFIHQSLFLQRKKVKSHFLANKISGINVLCQICINLAWIHTD